MRPPPLQIWLLRVSRLHTSLRSLCPFLRQDPVSVGPRASPPRETLYLKGISGSAGRGWHRSYFLLCGASNKGRLFSFLCTLRAPCRERTGKVTVGERTWGSLVSKPLGEADNEPCLSPHVSDPPSCSSDVPKFDLQEPTAGARDERRPRL